MSIRIGPIAFPNKVAAERYTRDILARYRPGQRITGEDEEFVAALVALHRNRAAVEDCGISYFTVQDIGKGWRRFLAHRKDSSIRDFSWRHAIYPENAKSRLMGVCRGAVQDQIKTFRARCFFDTAILYCPITGKALTSLTADIDHKEPDTFVAIVAGWLDFVRLEPEDIELVASAEYQQETRMADDVLAPSWREYHLTHARLRAVHPEANRSILRRKARV